MGVYKWKENKWECYPKLTHSPLFTLEYEEQFVLYTLLCKYCAKVRKSVQCQHMVYVQASKQIAF
ncbi:hypothetical protein LguiB_014245 [Lonicera macranthoides]